MAEGKLSLNGWCDKWKWRGQAVEELAMSIASITAPTPLSVNVEHYAPVATQDDDLKSIDSLSAKKVMLSINGVENQKQVEEGGYICVSQEITERYIQFYNEIVDSINSQSKYDLFRWDPKVYEL
jgi:hypothetical protein